MPITVDRLPAALAGVPHFELLRKLCAPAGGCLVGGALRDALLERPIADLDLAFPQDPTPIAKRFAREIGGHWFWLDRTRRQSRVVTGSGAGCVDYDFAPYRAASLHLDLNDRDFTVNAMAVPLDGWPQAPLVDPCGGLDDLRGALLRMVGPEAFAGDPLRIVKGVRHAVVLGFEIDPATSSAMRSCAPALAGVAVERVRLEFWKILADVHAGRGLDLLAASGAGEILFGAGFVASCPAMVARIAACRRQWGVLVDDHPAARGWLGDEVEQGLSSEILLLFASLCNEIDAGLAVRQAQAWKLSRRAGDLLLALSGLTAERLAGLSGVARTPRAFAWWALRLGLAPELLLPAIAVHRDLDDGVATALAWTALVERLEGRRPVDLVDGEWLAGLGIPRGPEMGRIMEMLRSAEISGEVDGELQAREFLARHCQNRD